MLSYTAIVFNSLDIKALDFGGMATGFVTDPEEVAESMGGGIVRWMRDWATGHGVALAGSVLVEEDGKYRK